LRQTVATCEQFTGRGTPGNPANGNVRQRVSGCCADLTSRKSAVRARHLPSRKCLQIGGLLSSGAVRTKVSELVTDCCLAFRDGPWLGRVSRQSQGRHNSVLGTLAGRFIAVPVLLSRARHFRAPWSGGGARLPLRDLQPVAARALAESAPRAQLQQRPPAAFGLLLTPSR
jgi:hypothetical protein